MIFGIFVNTIGYFIVNQCQIFSAKNEARARIINGLQVNNYFTITVDNKNSKDLKVADEDEIIWKGTLYDVVKKEIIDNKTVYTCLTDKQENDLISSANDEIQRQTGNNSSKHVLSIFKSIQLFFEEKNADEQIIRSEKKGFIISRPEKLLTAFLNIPCPPPWFC